MPGWPVRVFISLAGSAYHATPRSEYHINSCQRKSVMPAVVPRVAATTQPPAKRSTVDQAPTNEPHAAPPAPGTAAGETADTARAWPRDERDPRDAAAHREGREHPPRAGFDAKGEREPPETAAKLGHGARRQGFTRPTRGTAVSPQIHSRERTH